MRGKCGRTPTGWDSSSLRHPSVRSDMPPPDTVPGRPQERPGGHSAGTQWTFAASCSWTGSTKHTRQSKQCSQIKLDFGLYSTFLNELFYNFNFISFTSLKIILFKYFFLKETLDIFESVFWREVVSHSDRYLLL